MTLGLPQPTAKSTALSDPAPQIRDVSAVLSPPVAPVRQDERIIAVDTVRGFALLGILLLNILAFALPDAAAYNPNIAADATGWNFRTWFLVSVLFDGKLCAIFSMMFGASVYMLVERLSRKGAAGEAADIHYRRMLWMVLFGLIHAYLLWWGDVLYYYGIAGLFLYPLRKLSPRALLTAAAIMLLVMPCRSFYRYSHLRNLHPQVLQVQADEQAGEKLTADQEKTKKEWNDLVSDVTPSADQLREDYESHHNSWIALFKGRAQMVGDGHRTLILCPRPLVGRHLHDANWNGTDKNGSDERRTLLCVLWLDDGSLLGHRPLVRIPEHLDSLQRWVYTRSFLAGIRFLPARAAGWPGLLRHSHYDGKGGCSPAPHREAGGGRADCFHELYSYDSDLHNHLRRLRLWLLRQIAALATVCDCAWGVDPANGGESDLSSLLSLWPDGVAVAFAHLLEKAADAPPLGYQEDSIKPGLATVAG